MGQRNRPHNWRVVSRSGDPGLDEPCSLLACSGYRLRKTAQAEYHKTNRIRDPKTSHSRVAVLQGERTRAKRKDQRNRKKQNKQMAPLSHPGFVTQTQDQDNIDCEAN